MKPSLAPGTWSVRTIASLVLCAALVGTTALYLERKPLFFLLYGVLSVAGIYLIVHRGGGAISGLSLAVLCVQVAGSAVFLIIAAYHGLQEPPAPGVPHPNGFAFARWHQNIFFEAVIVVLCLFGLESASGSERGAGKPTRVAAWSILPALVIQGGLMQFWAGWEVSSVARLSSSTQAPTGRLAGITGTWLFGSYSTGLVAAEVLALTGFLALVAATLASAAVGIRAFRNPEPGA